MPSSWQRGVRRRTPLGRFGCSRTRAWRSPRLPGAFPGDALTHHVRLEIDIAPLGGVRCKRFALVVEGGKITHLDVEPDGGGLTCSLSNAILAKL
mmetsp:Transcript_52292/g.122499  ORF Transcript_52292/g.122499 Transcript_52292/m.122499 type:complete len:95 (-) Transcript_52292:64-348(-)